MDLRYEYSPESFMGTEMDYAVEICHAVLEELHATPEKRVILNLPTTVENCMPNYFADELEYFISKLPSRDCAIISLHPHNDRGCGVATAEMGLLAGAERIEATLFGNGERTGNVDIVTLALNMHTQGVDPELDFSHINRIKEMYERCTKMKVGERQPYAGELVFTAFSGSHQDAINKGTQYMRESGSGKWRSPSPHRPADVGGRRSSASSASTPSRARAARPSSCSTPSASTCPRPCTRSSATSSRWRPTGWAPSSSPSASMSSSGRTTIDAVKPYELVRHSFAEFTDEEGHSHVTFAGTLRHADTTFQVQGSGNGPIDAFFNAIHGQKMDHFTFVDYKEHAIKQGSDSQAVAYIHLRDENGADWFGVGMSHNINLAPLKGILSAINRAALHRD